MKKDFKKLACMGREIEWLVRDKYQGSICEVAFSYTKNDFSHCRLCRKLGEDIERLEKGEPIDYVIGWKEFLGCKIDLSEKPLIPREETEFWVDQVIKEVREVVVRSRFSRSQMRPRTPLRVLDLFAGSGCIGLAVLKHCPDVQMTFADKEEKCERQIKKNLKLNPVKLRHGASNPKVTQSDVFSEIKGSFDIIFANPPYIPTQKSKVQKSVIDWEPKQALYSGADGLVIIKKFLKESQNHLNPGGKIYLEFGYGQKKAIEALLKQNKYKNWEFRKDQFGRFRLVVIQ